MPATGRSRTVRAVDVARVEVGHAGVGAAAVPWDEVERELLSAARDAIERRLGLPVAVLGLQYLDADGGELLDALPRLLLIGFHGPPGQE